MSYPPSPIESPERPLMELTFACRACGVVGRVDPVERSDRIACPSCGESDPVAPAAIAPTGLAGCVVCGTTDLYVQKDFPQALGLAIVVVGFAISTVFWYYRMPLWTYAILLGSALLDMVLYYKVPEVTICYRCLAQYRGVTPAVGHRFAPFDLAIGERYRQERIRVDEHRRRSRGAAGVESRPS